jgi:FAD dependent oxidoreductase TIGR03364
LTVDPRQIVGSLPGFLAERYGVRFSFHTAVQKVETSCLEAAGERWEAGLIVVASGDDFETLFPEYFRQSGIVRCKLQMMRSVAQPRGWALGPALAFGPTFNHYPTFEVCPSRQALQERVRRERPELEKFGIHVMVSQNARGELTIGDSHEYGLAVDIFDKPEVNRLILDYARQYLRVPTLEIAESWHGVYAKHSERTYVVAAPADGVRMVTVTSGTGMTLSFGIAEQTLREGAPE